MIPSHKYPECCCRGLESNFSFDPHVYSSFWFLLMFLSLLFVSKEKDCLVLKFRREERLEVKDRSRSRGRVTARWSCGLICTRSELGEGDDVTAYSRLYPVLRPAASLLSPSSFPVCHGLAPLAVILQSARQCALL